MTQEQNPIPLGEPEWERGMWQMVAASGVLHVIAITLLIVVPYTFLHRPPALKSYTVDLVAPDHVGGTNMIAGGKGRVEGRPMAAAPKVEAPKPPPPKVEQPKPPEPKPAPQKVEPPKPEPPKEAAKPEPKPQPAKPEPQPKENEAVLAEKVKKEEPPPAPKPAPQIKPVAPKAIAKAQPLKAESKAVAEAAEKAAKEAAAAHARDEHIEAAVKRMQQQMGKRGAGSGTKAGEQPGAPISVGPGEGAGGTVRGVEYLLYYNQMINRIKQAWAWAGANQTLEATVRFNITENGEVVNVRITQPSGDPSYDASVERAVRAANPLPPPPDAYRKEFGDVELIFRPQDLTG